MPHESEKQITVKLKRSGWEVEITSSESQLKQAIEAVLSSIPPNSPIQTQAGMSVTEDAGNKTSRGLIIELWQESWFSVGRSLSDVHDEIARRGFHYDKTAISHSLLDLVKEGILTRLGNMRNYTYIQKRPAQSGAETSGISQTSSQAQ